jgi:GTP diphosphokinase / guanosine-3',5'-bis(diphosphate) 3'-diphosphatase
MDFLNNLIDVTLEKDQPKVQNAYTYLEKKLTKEEVEHASRVTKILIEKGLGAETLIAGLLHDTIYNKKSTFEDIKNNFGENVAGIVKEIAIIKEVVDSNYSRLDSETISSLVFSISSDLQTIIIILAEVTEMLGEALRESSHPKRLIAVTKEIYSPLALKLGIARSNWKIEDDCFKLESPEAYEKIKKLVNKTREEREALIEEVKEEISKLINGKIDFQISGRPKNFKAIHEKLKKTIFRNIHDLYGIRIICNKEKDCYEALGYVHSKYPIIPGAFDDYIAKPKSNGYKSIHTAIKRDEDILEVQIRTWEQHLRIESNLYWEYKKLKQNRDFEKKLSWERQLIEWQKSIGEESNKKKFYSKRIFVFTPKNEVISLPSGATTIDFGFAVHTDIGKKIKQAKVNGFLVPIETKLQNLDKVEIITDNKIQIKESWINNVITEKAKSKIKAHFGMTSTKKIKNPIQTASLKKIKMADCCHPLPGEDVIGVKTTKRKIIIHKKNCPNLKKISKTKLVEISFDKGEGKTQLKVSGIDRIGLLGEILNEIKKNNGHILKTNFDIKKSGYVIATFDIEIANLTKLEKLMEKLGKIPSINSIERI